ncbi:hypothetical protein HWV62_41378 [Athelia sp. TMB]|nr:hypothetical protein HWV62_41378 [Athelia sp. TMB]
MLSSITILLALLSSVLATPTGWVVQESRQSTPQGYVHLSAAPDDRILSMRINLAQRNLPGLESALEAVSSPSSPTFRQWLSTEQITSYAKPLDKTTNAVAHWLASNNVNYTYTTAARDWISLEVPVNTASKMFNTNFSIFSHTASGQTIVRTLEYSLPAAVQDHIRAVTPTTSFVRRSRLPSVMSPGKRAGTTSNTTIPSKCSSSITPACLQDLYNIPISPATNKNNSIGVFGMDDQFAEKSDLKAFLQKYRPDMSLNTTFTLQTLDNGTNPQDPGSAGGEAGSDYHDGDDQGYLDYINVLIGESSPPLVLTTSYGLDVESDLSLTDSIALCNSYMQLTAKGVSILFASGDGGVASTPGVQCNSTTGFPPTFPSCPYVTLVGATSGVPEIGASLSAGGFSNYFPTASWRDLHLSAESSAVSNYLGILGNKYAGLYNKSGRAYPDVSAQGVKVQVFIDGTVEPVDGTSCASPIFSSVIALINDQLLNAGKSPLGFLNPWLYANPSAFNDITKGSNPGCGTKGFPAAKGWDPVTGLGSPNYTALLAAANV